MAEKTISKKRNKNLFKLVCMYSHINKFIKKRTIAIEHAGKNNFLTISIKSGIGTPLFKAKFRLVSNEKFTKLEIEVANAMPVYPNGYTNKRLKMTFENKV